MKFISPMGRRNPLETSEYEMLRLKASPIYGQADPRSQRRMETMVSRGLPYNTDPQAVYQFGYQMGGTRPQYISLFGAVSPSSGGSIGMDREPRQRRTSQEASGSTGGSQAPQATAPEGFVRNRFGYLEPQKWYKDGAKMTESEYRKSQQNRPAPAMPQQDESWRFSLLGGVPPPIFPYGG